MLNVGSAGGYAGYFPWNSLAGTCAVGALASIVTLFFNANFRRWHLVAGAAPALMLVRADSATAYACSIGAAGAIVGIAWLRRIRPRTRPIVITLLGLVVLLVTINFWGSLTLASFSESMGRSEDLTGRTEIWAYAKVG